MAGKMAPLMYGFVRIDMLSDGLEQCEERLSEYARSDGFELAGVFLERGNGTAFEEMLVELERSETRHVLVPAMEHLCGLPVPRHMLMARLREIGACAWPLPKTQHQRAERP